MHSKFIATFFSAVKTGITSINIHFYSCKKRGFHVLWKEGLKKICFVIEITYTLTLVHFRNSRTKSVMNLLQPVAFVVMINGFLIESLIIHILFKILPFHSAKY